MPEKKNCTVEREEKDVFYDLAALYINVPVGVVGWLEAMACDNLLVKIGGHFWYDTSIPLSFFAYYAVAWANQPKQKRKSKMTVFAMKLL